MTSDSAETQRQQNRFYWQMLLLGPLALLWMYSLSDVFIFAGVREQIPSFRTQTTAGSDRGGPLRPASGTDVYLRGSMWKWEPQLVLKKGVSYNLHLVSTDVSHGFDVDAFDLHAVVEPNQERVLRLTPDKVGDFPIRCEEYCGPGHEAMRGRIRVEP